MKIWSNTLSMMDIQLAAQMAGVGVEHQFGHARKRSHRWNIALTGDSYHRPGQQWGNGPYRDEYGATWDQWGIFLAKLFEADPEMTTEPYADAEDFHWQTADRFHNITQPYRREDWDRRHKWWTRLATGAWKCDRCGAIRRDKLAAEGESVFEAPMPGNYAPI